MKKCTRSGVCQFDLSLRMFVRCVLRVALSSFFNVSDFWSLRHLLTNLLGQWFFCLWFGEVKMGLAC